MQRLVQLHGRHAADPTWCFTPAITEHVFATTSHACASHSLCCRAQLCTDTTVTVLPAADSFNAADAIFSLDVQQMSNAHDMEVLAGGAAKLSTLKGMAGATSHSSRRRLLATDSTASVDDIIALKANQLLQLLATASNDMLGDPAGIRQAVSAASSLMLPSFGSSMQRTLHGFTQAAIGSTVLAFQGLDGLYASDLLAMAAASNPGVSTMGLCLQPSGCGSQATVLRKLQQSASTSSFPTAITPVAAADAAQVLADLNAVSAQTMLTAQPNGDFISAGSSGLYVSVGNQQGSSYAGFTVGVGPAPQGAAISFSSPLQGPCLDNTSLSCDDALVPFIAQMVQLPSSLITVAPAAPNSTEVAAYIDAGNATTTPPLLDLELLTPAGRWAGGGGDSWLAVGMG